LVGIFITFDYSSVGVSSTGASSTGAASGAGATVPIPIMQAESTIAKTAKRDNSFSFLFLFFSEIFWAYAHYSYSIV
jgi:hypothetical protein